MDGEDEDAFGRDVRQVGRHPEELPVLSVGLFDSGNNIAMANPHSKTSCSIAALAPKYATLMAVESSSVRSGPQGRSRVGYDGITRAAPAWDKADRRYMEL